MFSKSTEQLLTYAMSNGFELKPLDELLITEPTRGLLQRLHVIDGEEDAQKAVAVSALFGLLVQQHHTVREAFKLYCDVIAVKRLVGKSESQKENWLYRRNRGVEQFVDVFGDLQMADISSYHGQAFFDWWKERVSPGSREKSYHPITANHAISDMSILYRAYWRYQGRSDIADPFKGFQFRNLTYKAIPAFSKTHLLERLLVPGSFGKLNFEARSIFYAMVETGCRASELCNLQADNIQLIHDIPHIRLRPRQDRALKTLSSERDIPLVGLALDVFREFPKGFPRYSERESSWNALMRQTLHYHDLMPTPHHRTYSLRHSFEARMIDAGIDYDIRCRLMGHKIDRYRYGWGAMLEASKKALARIVLPVGLDDLR